MLPEYPILDQIAPPSDQTPLCILVVPSHPWLEPLSDLNNLSNEE